MASRPDAVRSGEIGPDDLISAGVAGLVGGIAFAVLIVRVAPDQIDKIGALYGIRESPRLGLFVHINHSIVFGILYAWVVSVETLHRFAIRVAPGAILGLAFGIIVWLIAASILMPLWLGSVTSRSPQIPSVDLIFLAGHVAFGIILGVGYPLILSRMPDVHG